ncbi:hypothetical protein LY90DRAFT_219277 [Neocallimastix californiae]|uniref:Uncharacterized protein n=1 Tax=Neocallimastix californiae TaxID=1754190 RepID=A0A1Y2E5T0_9FUNG|nr:hypothetical protein LY90DRAFT_219277 [Neocallimastix californiae]|eukprot:ORY66882.1 hypothetical protein LY90DRAFT_219277 [Neocallimastix californiae]
MKYFYFISKYGPISNSNVDTTVITDRNTYIEVTFSLIIMFKLDKSYLFYFYSFCVIFFY